MALHDYSLCIVVSRGMMVFVKITYYYLPLDLIGLDSIECNLSTGRVDVLVASVVVVVIAINALHSS